MRLRAERIDDGPGPDEAIVEVKTADGTEEVVIDRNLLREGWMEVGHVLAQRNGAALVELPREGSSGRWRVWVPRSELA